MKTIFIRLGSPTIPCQIGIEEKGKEISSHECFFSTLESEIQLLLQEILIPNLEEIRFYGPRNAYTEKIVEKVKEFLECWGIDNIPVHFQ